MSYNQIVVPAEEALRSGTSTPQKKNALNSLMVDAAVTKINTTAKTSAKINVEKVRYWAYIYIPIRSDTSSYLV